LRARLKKHASGARIARLEQAAVAGGDCPAWQVRATAPPKANAIECDGNTHTIRVVGKGGALRIDFRPDDETK
jgi:hypothetical protein